MEDPKTNKDETKDEQVQQELTDNELEGVDGGASKNMKVISAVTTDFVLDNSVNR